MKIVMISDVHGKWNKITIPECDLLISAGDYSFKGEKHMIKEFHEWLSKQPARHIISVQGNHELWVEKNFEEANEIAEKACPGVHFVQEGLVEIEGKKIWCSAWTPWFFNWAWNAHRGDEIKAHWDLIPEGIDVLVTHGPPYGILDQLQFTNGDWKNEFVGCQQLYEAVMRLKPKVHVFGHIHCSYGYKFFNDIHFFNAAICGETYYPDNGPHTIEI